MYWIGLLVLPFFFSFLGVSYLQLHVPIVLYWTWAGGRVGTL